MRKAENIKNGMRTERRGRLVSSHQLLFLPGRNPWSLWPEENTGGESCILTRVVMCSEGFAGAHSQTVAPTEGEGRGAVRRGKTPQQDK